MPQVTQQRASWGYQHRNSTQRKLWPANFVWSSDGLSPLSRKEMTSEMTNCFKNVLESRTQGMEPVDIIL